MSHSLGISILKLPSHLVKSRHGVFYYRLFFRLHADVKERRFSLRTKDPAVAKAKALQLSAIMSQRHNSSVTMATQYDPKKFNPNDPGTWPSASDISENALRDLEIVFRPGTSEVVSIKTDPDKPKDILDAIKFISELQGLGLKATSSVVAIQEEDIGDSVGAVKPIDMHSAALPPVTDSPLVTSALSKDGGGGATVEDMSRRFATRKGTELTEKTLYEYSNYHRKFNVWLQKRKGRKNVPIRLVDRNDMAAYIDDLIAEGLTAATIQQKYFAAIGGLFRLARATGDIPFGYLPTEGHSIYSSRAKKKAEKNSYKPFSIPELQVIFDPANYARMEKPCDFWLPLLGLFTGGRIGELCQLGVNDIQLHDRIWSISINDEDGKSVKTAASKRLIPIHPQLIELGFLDYVEDVMPYGAGLFPYLIAHKYNGLSKTPGDRWGRYLDAVSIIDPLKVFHSFRSTSNNCLKENGVSEESRCQFVGHEHDTVNSKTYSDPYKLPFLLENVASKLIYPELNLERLIYQRENFKARLVELCADAKKFRNHRNARQLLTKVVKNK